VLEYQLQHGQVEQQIIEQAMKSGQPIPSRIENAPSIMPGLELYYIGFMELTSSRQMGWSIGPIPWLAIEQYCVMKGLDEEQQEAMHHHIIAMDTVYMKYQAKKQK